MGDGVGDGLGEVGLQLSRGNRQPVDEEHQIHRALIGGGEVHLPHDAHPHRRVVGVAFLVERRFGLEDAHLELRRQVREPLAEQVEGAAAVVQRCVKDFHDPVQQLGLLLGDVAGAGLDDLFQLLGLSVGKPAEDVVGEQGTFAVVAGVVWRVEPAMGGQVLGELLFELDLVVQSHVSGHFLHVDVARESADGQGRVAVLSEFEKALRCSDQLPVSSRVASTSMDSGSPGDSASNVRTATSNCGSLSVRTCHTRASSAFAYP